jgi:mercuric ion transport protein
VTPGRASPAALSLGALSAAVLSAICCVGPLLLAVAGLGGGALFLKIGPYRPHLLAVSAAFLLGAFYVTYRRQPQPACGSACEPDSRSRKQKVLLWITTAIVVLATADFIL